MDILNILLGVIGLTGIVSISSIMIFDKITDSRVPKYNEY